jgi:L-threonylcarbamoyladenylate synthase
MIRIRPGAARVEAQTLLPAVEALRSGGVVAFPTETFYGLAVDPRSARAVARIVELKQRLPDRPLPLIAADVDQVRAHAGVMTPLAERLAAGAWPGPLTLIIPASRDLFEGAHLSAGTIGVRVPADSIARALAAAFGHPITSTSANLSGQPPASAADDVLATFGDGVDVLIDAGPTPGGPPSTIVDATGDRPILVRDGAMAWERVLDFLR